MSRHSVNVIRTGVRFRPGIFKIALAAALSLLAFSSQVFATTVPYKSFDDLVKEADAIVSGRVASIESKYNPDHEIYTFVTFDQLEILGGSYQGQTLTLRFRGGQVENDSSQIVGSPDFEVNEQVVLFVHGNGQYMVPVVGWTQGVFRMAQDAATGQQVIHDNEGNRVFGVKSGQVLKEHKTAPAIHIVSRSNRGVSSESNGEAGNADYNPSGVAAAKVEKSALATPAITRQSFLGTIRAAAAAKTAQRELRSVNVNDFSIASSRADVSVGAKAAATDVPNSQSPAKPQRKPVVEKQDQQ